MNRAILVREKVGRLVTLLTEKKITVTQRGAKAFVQFDSVGRPVRINIPYIPDDADEKYLGAIEGFLDHEVAHVLFSDYKVIAQAKKDGVGRLHNIIEDAFIEKKMAESFAGSGLNLTNTGEFFLKNYTDKEIAKNPENAMGVLMVPAIRALSGQKVFKDYMADKWGMLAPVMEKIGHVAEKMLLNVKSSSDALAVANEFRKLMEEPGEDDGEGDDDGSGSMKSKGGKSGKDGGKGKSKKGSEKRESDDESEDESEDDKSGDPAMPSFSDPEGDDEASDDEEFSEPKSDTEDPGAVDSSDSTGGGTHGDTTGPDLAGDGEGEDGSGESPSESASGVDYSELERSLEDFDEKLAEALTEMSVDESKSSDYLVWSKDFDRVEKMGIPSYHGEEHMKAMTDAVDHMLGPLQKDLERAIAARSASVWSVGHRSGKLHSSALTRLTVFGDDRAFRRRFDNPTKDVAVELVVDCSGSMGGDKIEVAAYAAYGLSSVLDRMNINHEVIGFTTGDSFPVEARVEARETGLGYARTQALYLPIIKDFSERMSTDVKKRLSALPSVNWLNENVDGESVQIVATRLLKRREKRKIMIVLSDGQPACPGDFHALRGHLKKSVHEIEAQGIDVVAIGIQSTAPQNFYSKSVVLNNVSDLPTEVMGQLKRLLMQ